jgi:hypothetical protein
MVDAKLENNTPNKLSKTHPISQNIFQRLETDQIVTGNGSVRVK